MNGIDRTPFLSICIPTFNRAEHVYSLVKDILRCQSNEIEVVVLDNYSTDNTKDLLGEIDDIRFVFLQNSKNIGAVLNLIKVLTLANGKYALLCIDRDYLESQYISPLIDSLRKDTDIVWGYCSYGSKEKCIDEKFEKGFASVLNMAYLSNHPSGEFYNTSVLKKLKIIEEVNNKYSNFSFCHELLNAEISFYGSSLRIHSPIIKAAFSNSKEDFALNKTHSFSNANFYFMPAQRIVEFSTYMINISTMNLSSKEKRVLFKVLYLRGLIFSTYQFKKDLIDSQFCSHYRIETRKVSLFEILKYDLYFSLSFLKLKITLNYFWKIYIFIASHYILFYHLFSKIKKNVKSENHESIIL